MPARLRVLRAAMVLCALALVAAPAGLAHAQGKRIVVIPFSGSGGGRIADTTGEVLAQAGHTVVSAGDYRDAASKLDARGRDPADIAKVAAEVGVDAVIFGDIERPARLREVTVHVHAGATGVEVGTFRFTAKRRRLNKEEQATVRDGLVPLLDNLEGGPVRPAPRTPAGDQDIEMGGDQDIEMGGDQDIEMGGDPDIEMGGDTPERPTTTTGTGPVEQVSDTEDAFDAVPAGRTPASTRDRDDGDEGPKASSSTRRAMDVAAGLSLNSRFLRASTQAGATGPEYNGTVAPGVFIDAEVYPAAFGPESMPARAILSNIGIRVLFDRVLFLTSGVEGGGQSADLDTTHMRFGVGLVYRYFFGDADNAPVIKLGVGYDRLQFSLDKDAAPAGIDVDLPNVAYSSIDPGVAFTYPISGALAVTADARLLLVLGAGEVEDMDEYGGTSSSLGFDIGAEVEYEILPRLSVRGALRFVDVTLAFDGTGARTDRDGNAATQEVDGITDYYIGAQVTAGYRF
ncbi:hypothetical protein [Haliangium sp.]|uniref:hypothetical protein n=1 Tax=Haliangium sp. TaxID=2663208 RepID=UPI003D1163D6